MIGHLRFFTLSPPPEIAKESVELVTRQGVNGTAAWLTGQRGVPRVHQTKVDCLTVGAADATFTNQYRPLIGAIVNVIWANLAMGQFLVKDVRNKQITALALSSGGLLGGAGRAWLEAEWELISIQPT